MNTPILSQNYAQLNAIIPTFNGEINGITQPLVNARDLHTFLESKQDFSNWINKRIVQYRFIENQDYLHNNFIVQLPSGSKHKIEYHLTLDMAKELSMVERNHKGRMARQHFIECERQIYALLNQEFDLNLDYIETLQAELLKARPIWQDITRYKELGLGTHEIAKLVGRSKSTVNSHIRQMQALHYDIANEPQPAQLAFALEV